MPERALWRATRLLRPVSGRLVAATVLAAAAAGSAVALMAVSAWLVTRAAQQPPVLVLMVAIVSVRAFGLGRGVLRYLERLAAHDAALRALGAIRVRAYRRLERLAPAGLTSWRRGELLGRFVADVDELADLALRGLVPLGSTLVVAMATIALATALLPGAGLLLALGLLIAGVLAPWAWARASRRTEEALVSRRAERDATIVELLDQSTDLVASGAAEQWLQRIDRSEAQITQRQFASARLAGLGVFIAIASVGAAVLGSFLLAVPQVRAGTVSGPVLALLVLTPLALSELVGALPGAAQQLQRVRRSAERVFDVLDSPAPTQEPTDPRRLPTDPAGVHITVRDLHVCWPGQDRAALRGVNLDAPPGSRVVVLGPTGCGKSTLLSALLRFVDPSSGQITLNGVDTRHLSGDEVRSVMALADQDAHVFDSTIRQNLLLARGDAPPAAIDRVLDQVGLRSWVDGLRHGLDTRVGEHGAMVSGGQRQRIAVARALLAERPVVLLDEPTAGLDETAAAELMRVVLRATQGVTTILVTHRTVDLPDVDVVLDLTAVERIETPGRGPRLPEAARGPGDKRINRRPHPRRSQVGPLKTDRTRGGFQ